MKLTDKVSVLNGVGDVVAKRLARLGIETIQDLLLHYPRRWEDYSQVTAISQTKPGEIAVVAELNSIATRRSFRRRLTITEAVITDQTGSLKVVWFNQPFVANQLKAGERYFWAGKLEFKGGYLSLNNPMVELAGATTGGKIFPVYPETSQLSSKQLRRYVGDVISLCDGLRDNLPDEIVQNYDLISFGQAVRQLHQPTTMQQVEQARRRIGFGELFGYMLTGLYLRDARQSESSAAMAFELAVVKQLVDGLPFELTDGQRKATWQILQDMEKPQPMNRLLQGDVGSGKTVVALIAAAMAAHHGYQTAYMAPTEILAAQHADTASTLLKPLGLRVGLLVASLKSAAKRELQEQIGNGSIDLVIGTHALLSEKVAFKNLGLVEIDEQHRFGVQQRTALRSKASISPHMLTMTATPIPRSLALVVYGDLDISVISELPAERKPVTTQVFTEAQRLSAYQHIEQRLGAGEQAFVVCPRIIQDDSSGKKSVEAEYDRLRKSIFAHRRIGLLHGRMKADDKAAVMSKFAAGKLDILVSTTVVEVGVNVPNATVMLIEGADGYGLASLHQLRGRVGRSDKQSYCYLIGSTENPESLARLKSLEKTHDGLRLAQIDLMSRGPGEVYGKLQHGYFDLRMASLTDTLLIEQVREAAQAFLSSDNMVKYPQIEQLVLTLAAQTSIE
jgi:ATP-dependent DNA helicase RecG